MIMVKTEILIEAPIKVCFDLARDIDIHTRTVWKHTRERAISGRTNGSINAGETVTFEATHFLVRQKLTSKIIELKEPYLFTDQMLSGAFKSMKHIHEFIESESGTLMKDTLEFEAPFGIIGWLMERAILKNYMKSFLEHRNRNLKEFAERLLKI